jgi:hypothetical protein
MRWVLQGLNPSGLSPGHSHFCRMPESKAMDYALSVCPREMSTARLISFSYVPSGQCPVKRSSLKGIQISPIGVHASPKSSFSCTSMLRKPSHEMRGLRHPELFALIAVKLVKPRKMTDPSDGSGITSSISHAMRSRTARLPTHGSDFFGLKRTTSPSRCSRAPWIVKDTAIGPYGGRPGRISNRMSPHSHRAEGRFISRNLPLGGYLLTTPDCSPSPSPHPDKPARPSP